MFNRIIVALLGLFVFVPNAWGASSSCVKTSVDITTGYPRFTHYMKGHRGEKCWYPEAEGFERADRSEKRAQVVDKPKVKVRIPVAVFTPPPPTVTPPVTPPPIRIAPPSQIVEVAAPAGSPVEEAHRLFDESKDEFAQWAFSDRLITVGYELWLCESIRRHGGTCPINRS